jgi:hypothetical protein
MSKKMILSEKYITEYMDTEKVMYASNGKGVKLYIKLNSTLQVYVAGNLVMETKEIGEAIECFNTHS